MIKEICLWDRADEDYLKSFLKKNQDNIRKAIIEMRYNVNEKEDMKGDEWDDSNKK